MAIRVCVLGSGSSGNSTLVASGDSALLVDAGLSASETARRLEVIGLSLSCVKAVCVTHEHSDHIAGLKVLHQKHGVGLFANSATVEAIQAGGKVGVLTWQVFQTGQSFNAAGMDVQAFSVPHDSYDPVGFLISVGNVRVGVVTDIGMATTLVKERLKLCSILVIEANHDESLLKDSRRPWYLKQRIASRQGHMANSQAAALLAEVAHPGLKAVFLAHMSSECNRPDVAMKTMSEVLQASGVSGIELKLTYPDKPSEVVELAAE